MTDLSNIIRADFIAGHRARVAQLTAAEIHAAEHSVRDGRAILDAHQERAYRSDIVALLTELKFEPKNNRAGFPSLDFHTEEHMARAVAEICAATVRMLPRRWRYINDRMHFDGLTVYWALTAEPDGSDYPYEARA